MAKNFVLYRALHDWDDSSSGIDLTDRYANLSIKEHVERGGFRVYKRSQYISTTRDLPHALRWVSEDKSALAIILCRYLHPRVRITDISEGYPGVSWKYGKFVSMHEEHLVEPFINPSAVRICTYDELINIYRGRYHPKFLQEMSRSGRKSFLRGIRIQFSLRCCYCGGHGHDIECGHCCQEYEEQFCDRCNEYGHDCDGSDYDESDSDDQGWDEPYCYHCDEYGHDCDGSDDEDQGEEPFCYRCNEYGHDCNGFSDGDQGEEEPFCSSCNEYGHDCDGSDDEDQGGYGLFCSYCNQYGHSEDNHHGGSGSESDDEDQYCANCNEYGHDEYDCEDSFCYYCRKYGHDDDHCREQGR
ncbi:hypothetical protein EMPS_09853 [Entomortierella parvispora]|uniref:CCHC-type domain-containing protein n=1 Tax=Entomortierella parvispora TaxID=205924 RepID=A0A9P3HIS2_9FUNG|nr:hypothetical protein EMPS_09853 [Entomortierella parvispora]